MVSTICHYCGAALVDCRRARETIDRVVPFRVPEAAARAALSDFLRRAWWAPESLRRGRSTKPWALQGIYVPFFSYSASVRGRYRARIGLHWSRRRSKPEPSPCRDLGTNTEWFELEGTIVDQLDHHLVPATLGLTAPEASRLQPYDLGHARPLDTRWLAGFTTELPSRRRDEVDATARELVHDIQVRRLETELLAGDVRVVERLDCDIDLQRVQLVALPVWVARVELQGRTHRLLVNGQSGRCVGRTPLSSFKLTLFALAIAAATSLLLWFMGVVAWT